MKFRTLVGKLNRVVLKEEVAKPLKIKPGDLVEIDVRKIETIEPKR